MIKRFPLVQVNKHWYAIDVDAEIKAGDKILCDERNHISDPPEYVIRTCKDIENGWIMTEVEGQGENPAWTSKIMYSTDESLGVYLLSPHVFDYYKSLPQNPTAIEVEMKINRYMIAEGPDSDTFVPSKIKYVYE